MYVKIIKSDDKIISETRLSVATTSTHWILENFQFPEPITSAFVKTHSCEEIKIFTKKPEIVILDSEDSSIEYHIYIHTFNFMGTGNIMLSITTDIYENGKYLFGNSLGKPLNYILDFPKYKKELKRMLQIHRESRNKLHT